MNDVLIENWTQEDYYHYYQIEFYNEEGDSSTIVAKNGANANHRKRPKRIKSHKNKPPNASLPKDNQEDIDVEQEKD